MTIWNINLRYDSISVMNAINETLIDRGYFADPEGKQLEKDNITLGMSNKGETAFLIYAYKDTKSVRIVAHHNSNSIEISTGFYDKKTNSVGLKGMTLKSFNALDQKQLLQASNFLEEFLNARKFVKRNSRRRRKVC